MDQLQQTLDRYLSYRNSDRKHIEIAFYGGNFLGLPSEQCQFLLQWASSLIRNGSISGIRFSTRPDTIDRERLDWLSDTRICAVELGVQSMQESVLTASLRGHTVSDTVKAVQLLKSKQYPVGLQLMAGLPGETDTGALDSARKVSELSPDFVRIYPTVVLSGSKLATDYRRGLYQPLTVKTAIRRVKPMVRLLGRLNIPIVRIGLQADKELDSGSAVLAGPYHPAFGEKVYSGLFLDQAVSHLRQIPTGQTPVRIRIHPKNRSKMQGNGNFNQRYLQQHFGKISIMEDPDLADCEIGFESTIYSIYDEPAG